MRILILILCSFSIFANCPQGMELVNNRCVLSQQTLTTARNASQCDGLTGSGKDACFIRLTCQRKSDEESKSECLELVSSCEGRSDFAQCLVQTRREQQEARRSGFSSVGGSLFKAPNAIALLIGALAMTQVVKEGAFCRAPSASLLVAGSLSILGAEVLTHLGYKKRLKELEEKYTGDNNGAGDFQNLASNEDSGDPTQSKAFDLLIEQEEIYQKAIKSKRAGYLISSVMFTAAGLMAVAENLNPIGQSTFFCKKSTTTDADGKTSTTVTNSSKFGKIGVYGGLAFAAMAPLLFGSGGFVQTDPANKNQHIDSIFKMQEAYAYSKGETYEFDQKMYDDLKSSLDSLGLKQVEKDILSQSMQMAQQLVSSPFYHYVTREISSNKS